ncbi:MAG: CNNM domain-containing protein [Gemmatimonadetes bacterium]|nr:CNNM domain-containing protein [Gemmatimonadota bacterium]
MTGLAMFLAVAALGVLTLGATAVRAVSRLWLRHWIEQSAGNAGDMTRYLERPMRLVHAAGTAGMLVVFATGSLIAMSEGLRAWSFARDLLLFLLALLIFGQLLPRAVGRRWAPKLVPVVVPVLRVVDMLLAPFHVLAARLGRVVQRSARAPQAEAREGLEELLRDGAFDDMSASEELAIISGVVQFGDKTVRDVMTVRDAVFALDEALPADELVRRIAQSGYSRVPLYRGSPDHVVGMVHVFDVFTHRQDRRLPVRPVTMTAPTRLAKELLFELLRARRQLAIVQDGATMVGLVTLEDLLEELVGDIRDEHDDSTD